MKVFAFVLAVVAFSSCSDVTTLPKVIQGDWRYVGAADDYLQTTPDDLNTNEAFVRWLEDSCQSVTITANQILFKDNREEVKDTFAYSVRNSVSSIGVLQIARTGHVTNVSVFSDTLQLRNVNRVYAFVRLLPK